MNKKLTISVDDSVIELAKEYARSKGQSLSQIIENYLKMISGKTENSKISAKVSKLKGKISIPENVDYKDLISGSITDKYIK